MHHQPYLWHAVQYFSDLEDRGYRQTSANEPCRWDRMQCKLSKLRTHRAITKSLYTDNTTLQASLTTRNDASEGYWGRRSPCKLRNEWLNVCRAMSSLQMLTDIKFTDIYIYQVLCDTNIPGKPENLPTSGNAYLGQCNMFKKGFEKL